MTGNENGFYAWIKTQSKRQKRTLEATKPKVVEGLACASYSTQNGNGQHPSLDERRLKLSDGVPSAEWQAKARELRDSSCINHSKPAKKHKEFAAGFDMTEEEFDALEPETPKTFHVQATIDWPYPW
jgi:hypothetical protein